MAKQAEICETYQLKWSSYSSYIHSCISTSLHNDSFTDVALVTTDGHQIMAHRFVLSYSSQFLAQILKMQRKVTTALPLMIVLPPEIDHKSLKVLVRYMYSGEAKVSKEILNNVLRGGDILQIKGLYREKEDLDKNVKITQNVPPKMQTVANSPVSTPPPLTTPVTTTTQVQKPNAHPMVQKKSPAPTQSQPKPQEKPVINAGPKFIVVQKSKEPLKYSNPRQKVLNFTIMQNFDKNAQNKDDSSKGVTILNKSLNQTTNEAEQDENVQIKTEPKEKDNLQYLMIKDEPIDWTEADMEIIESKEVYEEMTIKSEHTETNESESNGEEEDDEEDDEEEEDTLFSPLTCELCTERFTIPAEWVRHVQTHTDMLPAKRRRRDSTGDSYENDTFPELMCDMCQKSFATPAEWVRHIQNSHSEFELHMSNRKAPKDKDEASTSTATSPQATGKGNHDKCCKDCNKSFPSHASMVIHQRKHTGEKPFTCDYCPKSFNVKSNLLRHLRTLHDKIINSGEIENKGFSDNSN